MKNQFEKLWTVPFGKVSVSFVYSFSFDAIFSFNPKRLLCLNFSSINKGVYRSSIEENAPYDVDVVDFEQPFEDFNEYIQVVDEDYTIKEIIKNGCR